MALPNPEEQQNKGNQLGLADNEGDIKMNDQYVHHNNEQVNNQENNDKAETQQCVINYSDKDIEVKELAKPRLMKDGPIRDGIDVLIPYPEFNNQSDHKKIIEQIHNDTEEVVELFIELQGLAEEDEQDEEFQRIMIELPSWKDEKEIHQLLATHHESSYFLSIQNQANYVCAQSELKALRDLMDIQSKLGDYKINQLRSTIKVLDPNKEFGKVGRRKPEVRAKANSIIICRALQHHSKVLSTFKAYLAERVSAAFDRLILLERKRERERAGLNNNNDELSESGSPLETLNEYEKQINKIVESEQMAKQKQLNILTDAQREDELLDHVENHLDAVLEDKCNGMIKRLEDKLHEGLQSIGLQIHNSLMDYIDFRLQSTITAPVIDQNNDDSPDHNSDIIQNSNINKNNKILENSQNDHNQIHNDSKMSNDEENENKQQETGNNDRTFPLSQNNNNQEATQQRLPSSTQNNGQKVMRMDIISDNVNAHGSSSGTSPNNVFNAYAGPPSLSIPTTTTSINNNTNVVLPQTINQNNNTMSNNSAVSTGTTSAGPPGLSRKLGRVTFSGVELPLTVPQDSREQKMYGTSTEQDDPEDGLKSYEELTNIIFNKSVYTEINKLVGHISSHLKVYKADEKRMKLNDVIMTNDTGYKCVMKIIGWIKHFTLNSQYFKEQDMITLCIQQGLENGSTLQQQLSDWLQSKVHLKPRYHEFICKILYLRYDSINMDVLKTKIMDWELKRYDRPNIIAQNYQMWFSRYIYEINTYNETMAKVGGQIESGVTETEIVNHFIKELSIKAPSVGQLLNNKIVKFTTSKHVRIKWQHILHFLNQVDKENRTIGGLSFFYHEGKAFKMQRKKAKDQVQKHPNKQKPEKQINKNDDKVIQGQTGEHGNNSIYRGGKGRQYRRKEDEAAPTNTTIGRGFGRGFGRGRGYGYGRGYGSGRGRGRNYPNFPHRNGNQLNDQKNETTQQPINRICKWDKVGTCKYGDKCKFIHSQDITKKGTEQRQKSRLNLAALQTEDAVINDKEEVRNQLNSQHADEQQKERECDQGDDDEYIPQYARHC